MEKLQSSGDARTVYTGKLFRVVHQRMYAGKNILEFERVIRPPGVRLIIVRNGELLMTREYRTELSGFDYRLPGGKVFDTIEEFTGVSSSELLRYAKEAAKRECAEETGLQPINIKHFYTSKSGATIEWDLYYFIVDDFIEGQQHLETGEHIEVCWCSFADAKKLCLDGHVQEDRTLGILLRFLLNEISYTQR